jgi:hypothetical protein
MDIIDSPQKGRLLGRAILLSASVPSLERAEIYTRIEAAEAIEEAVVSLARAVFSEGGTLVFGGHPTISPLVALVLREYLTPRVAERFREHGEGERHGPQVEIYQSEAYRERVAVATQRLKQHAGVRVHWIESVGGEVADPDVRDRPQAPESMRRMRLDMLKRNDLVGMVCIGGMEGVEEEAKLLHDHRKELPIYALESTGGAASKLALGRANREWVRVPEHGVRERVESFWHHERERDEHGRKSGNEMAFAFPYAYIAQKIVAELINPEERGEQRARRR